MGSVRVVAEALLAARSHACPTRILAQGSASIAQWEAQQSQFMRWDQLPDAGVCPVAEEPNGCCRQLGGCSSLLKGILQLQGMSGALGCLLPGA